MTSNNSSTNTSNNDTDENRVNYWLNYLSDMSEEESQNGKESEKYSSSLMEDSPSGLPDSQNLTGLGGLGEILLGNAENSGSNANEFELLQEILVRPEITEFRERIGKLEDQYSQIETSSNAKDLAEIFLPLMSKLLNRKLAKLKKEIIGEMTPLIERLIEEKDGQRDDIEKHLSIRVMGIQKDAD